MTDKHEPRFCDGPNCDNDVGLFLLAGVAITGDALGDKAFCCEVCAEEWLDWMRGRVTKVDGPQLNPRGAPSLALGDGGSRRSAVFF